MAKEELLEFPGEVVELLPNATFKVELENGQQIRELTIRYETYGELDADKSNAILICHALTGDHHCAGIHTPDERKPGWWNHAVGPGKTIDTDRFHVICSNCLGACQGSTGPTSANPDTGKPYGVDFPDLTIADMVAAQKRLIDHLGIEHLRFEFTKLD